MCALVPRGSMSEWPNKSTEKVRLGVDTHVSVGHRWCGGQNVKLRLWGRVEEEEGGGSQECMCNVVCVNKCGGCALFWVPWRICALFKCLHECEIEYGKRSNRKSEKVWLREEVQHRVEERERGGRERR